MYKVTSEIYAETNFDTIKCGDGKVISKFKFRYPNEGEEEEEKKDINGDLNSIKDKDGDYIVKRRDPEKKAVIEIAHSNATEIRLVGLQVWRGALLLADFIFHIRKEIKDQQILELGAGVGLTSLAAAIYAKRVICSDVDIGGILDLIRSNVKRNSTLFEGDKLKVLECNFLQNVKEYSPDLLQAIDDSDIVLAADVIYEDALIDGFINVIDNIFARENVSGRRKIIYVALEKRFVFTTSEVDTVAPMFEYFIQQTMTKPWRFEYIPLDFPQYFNYERCKQLILLKLTSK